MSTQNNSNGLNGTTKWVVTAFLTLLLGITIAMGSRTYEGANIAFALAPVVSQHAEDIKILKNDSQDSKIQDGIINNKLDLVLEELKELKKNK